MHMPAVVFVLIWPHFGEAFNIIMKVCRRKRLGGTDLCFFRALSRTSAEIWETFVNNPTLTRAQGKLRTQYRWLLSRPTVYQWQMRKNWMHVEFCQCDWPVITCTKRRYRTSDVGLLARSVPMDPGDTVLHVAESYNAHDVLRLPLNWLRNQCP